MLVLTRKLGQQVLIGNGVVVKVLAVRGRQVRLGIDAPKSLRVLRAESVLPQPEAEETPPRSRRPALAQS